MEEVEKLAFNILGTVIVFIIVIYGMYKWLGTPECDSLANQTALQLKIAIEMFLKMTFLYGMEVLHQDPKISDILKPLQ